MFRTGYLEAILPSVPLNTLVGQTVSLEVSTSNSSSFRYASRHNLNWFFNGQIIYNSSDSLIMNGNTSLRTNIREGVYETRYEEISVIPQDKSCEVNLLKFLRRYSFMKPARFYVNTKGE